MFGFFVLYCPAGTSLNDVFAVLDASGAHTEQLASEIVARSAQGESMGLVPLDSRPARPRSDECAFFAPFTDAGFALQMLGHVARAVGPEGCRYDDEAGVSHPGRELPG